MHHLIEVWFHWVLTGGYAAVFWLMALESTIIPIPSEVVILPAAIVAATQQGTGMSLLGGVIAGSLGARWAGRREADLRAIARCGRDHQGDKNPILPDHWSGAGGLHPLFRRHEADRTEVSADRDAALKEESPFQRLCLKTGHFCNGFLVARLGTVVIERKIPCVIK